MRRKALPAQRVRSEKMKSRPSKLARIIYNLRLELRTGKTRGKNHRRLTRAEKVHRQKKLRNLLSQRLAQVLLPEHKRKRKLWTATKARQIWPRRTNHCEVIRTSGSTAFRRIKPKWFLPANTDRQSLTAKRFVSVFGGKGNGCQYMLRKRKWAAALVDMVDSVSNDLTAVRAQKDCQTLLSQCDGAGFDVCCRSFSTARRAPPGSRWPNRVRSKQCLWGLPGLKPADAKMVRDANALVKWTASRVRTLALAGIPGYVENPTGSYLWNILQALLEDLFAAGLVHYKTTHFCMYGTPHKKPTKLLVWGPRAATVRLRRCHHRGPCKRTGLKHIPLSSQERPLTNDEGAFKTREAQVHPMAFVEHLFGQLF